MGFSVENQRQKRFSVCDAQNEEWVFRSCYVVWLAMAKALMENGMGDLLAMLRQSEIGRMKERWEETRTCKLLFFCIRTLCWCAARPTKVRSYFKQIDDQFRTRVNWIARTSNGTGQFVHCMCLLFSRRTNISRKAHVMKRNEKMASNTNEKQHRNIIWRFSLQEASVRDKTTKTKIVSSIEWVQTSRCHEAIESHKHRKWPNTNCNCAKRSQRRHESENGAPRKTIRRLLRRFATEKIVFKSMLTAQAKCWMYVSKNEAHGWWRSTTTTNCSLLTKRVFAFSSTTQ